jgi:hypothetical protein
MRRSAYLFLIVLLGAGPAAAQGTGQPSAPGPFPALQPPRGLPAQFPAMSVPGLARPAPPAQPDPSAAAQAGGLVSFDPRATELRWVNNSWQLQAGGVLLKNFGGRQVEAWQALGLVRGLHLTQHGTLGSPQPILEYWLSEGRAPEGVGAAGLRLVPLDVASLRAEPIQHQWCVRDARRVLFNFGARQAEAAQAVELIRHYGFTQVGYLGWPNPVLMCFLGGPAGASGSLEVPPFPTDRPAAQPDPRASLLQARVLASGAYQLAPPTTAQGSVVHFDPGHVEVKQGRGGWSLVYGPQVLASFAARQDARQAEAVVRQFRFTEQYVLGPPGAGFMYFLAHGQAPVGLRFGVPSQPFNPEEVAVRQAGKDWVVGDAGLTLANFGDRRDLAQELARVIRRYDFDHLCQVGPAGPLPMTFLVRTR